MRPRVLAAMLLLAVAAGCAFQETFLYEGKTVPFRGRWWSYYQRGASRLAQGDNAGAAADFERALRGRGDDAWSARTYGLHFTEYFPNREMGVALYQMSQASPGDTALLDRALASIETSLSQVDSARGHFYRDQVLSTQIAQGSRTDTSDPGVILARADGSTLASGAVLSQLTTPLAVTATDDTGVASVSLDGRGLYQRGSAPERSFTGESLILKEGAQQVNVQVRDLAGKEQTQTLDITVDLTGPTIGLGAPMPGVVEAGETARLTGAVVDKSGIATITVGDVQIPCAVGAARADYTADVPLSPGENTIVIVAKDIAGNETRMAVKVFQGAKNSTAARLWRVNELHPEMLQMASLAPDGFTSAALDAILAQAEAAPPAAEVDIKLKTPQPEKAYYSTTDQTLRVAGTVTTASGVASLAINGQPYDTLTGMPQEAFDRRVPLSDAEIAAAATTIAVTVAAGDKEGKTAEAKVDAKLRAVDLANPDFKLPLAIMAFGAGQPVPAADPAAPPTPAADPAAPPADPNAPAAPPVDPNAQAPAPEAAPPASASPLANDVRSLVQASLVPMQRFRVLERQNLVDVLGEQQLSAALGDKNMALQLGKVIPAQFFLVGDIIQRGDALELVGSVVNTETSEIVKTIDANIANVNDLEQLKTGCNELAIQLTKAFPRPFGQVMFVKSDQMMVDLKQDDGLYPGSPILLIYDTPDEVDPGTGEVVWPGETGVWGKAKVLSFSGTGAKAQLQPEEAVQGEAQKNVTLEKGMAVIPM